MFSVFLTLYFISILCRALPVIVSSKLEFLDSFDFSKFDFGLLWFGVIYCYVICHYFCLFKGFCIVVSFEIFCRSSSCLTPSSLVSAKRAVVSESKICLDGTILL